MRAPSAIRRSHRNNPSNRVYHSQSTPRSQSTQHVHNTHSTRRTPSRNKFPIPAMSPSSPHALLPPTPQPMAFRIRPAQHPKETYKVLELYLELIAAADECQFRARIPIAQEIGMLPDASVPGPFTAPTGRLFVAVSHVDNSVIGFAALQSAEQEEGASEDRKTVCILRRLYCTPSMRGRNVGKALLEEVVISARTLRYDEIRMTLCPHMTETRILCTSSGFEVAAANDVSQLGTELIMVKRLSLFDFGSMPSTMGPFVRDRFGDLGCLDTYGDLQVIEGLEIVGSPETEKRKIVKGRKIELVIRTKKAQKWRWKATRSERGSH